MNDLILDNPSRRMLMDVSMQGNDNALTPFRHALGAVWSNRLLAGVTAAVIFGLVMGGGFLMNRSHYAEAMLEIQSGHENLEQVNQQNMQGMPPDTSAIDTEVEILRSPAVAEAVVRKYKLTEDPEFGAAAKPGLIHRAVSALMGGTAPQSLSQSEVMRRTVNNVMGHSRIRRIGLTYMVQVGFVASTSQKAETMANAIVANTPRRVDFVHLPMNTYSSGMGARLRFAIAAARAPDILLIDEALATGDAKFRRRSEKRILELREHAGTVFLVSHGLGIIRQTCTRAIWLEDGLVVLDGNANDVVDAYERRYDPDELAKSARINKPGVNKRVFDEPSSL